MVRSSSNYRLNNKFHTKFNHRFNHKLHHNPKPRRTTSGDTVSKLFYRLLRHLRFVRLILLTCFGICLFGHVFPSFSRNYLSMGVSLPLCFAENSGFCKLARTVLCSLIVSIHVLGGLVLHTSNVFAFCF